MGDAPLQGCAGMHIICLFGKHAQQALQDHKKAVLSVNLKRECYELEVLLECVCVLLVCKTWWLLTMGLAGCLPSRALHCVLAQCVHSHIHLQLCVCALHAEHSFISLQFSLPSLHNAHEVSM